MTAGGREGPSNEPLEAALVAALFADEYPDLKPLNEAMSDVFREIRRLRSIDRSTARARSPIEGCRCLWGWFENGQEFLVTERHGDCPIPTHGPFVDDRPSLERTMRAER